MAKKQYLELSDGSSHKFWEITLDGSEVKTRWGRIGTDGQVKTKAFGDAAQAAKTFAKQLAGKQAKGYAVVTQATSNKGGGKASAKKATAKRKPAARNKPPAKKTAARRFVERCLHVEGAKATKLIELWRSKKATETAIDESLKILGDAVDPTHVPAWLKLDASARLETVVHVAAPVFVADPDDEDELMGRFEERKMAVLDLRTGTVSRSNGKGTSKDSKLTAADLGDIDAVEYPDSNPMSGLLWRDDCPDKPAAFKKWVKALAKCAGGEVEPYDVAEYTSATVASASPIAGPHAHGHGGPQRTNAFPEAGPKKRPKKLWKAKDQAASGGEYGGDPVVCDGVVYGVAGNWAKASAVSAKNGKVLWTTQLSQAQSWSTGATAVAGGVAYFPTKEGLHAVDAKKGGKRWLARCKGQASSPVVADGVVVFGGLGELIAVSPETGRKVWKHAVDKVEQVGPAAYHDGVVYALAIDTKKFKTSRILGLEAATGRVLFELKKPWLYGAPPPMIVDGQMLCTVDRGQLGALDPKTGKQLWAAKIDAKEVAATGEVLVVRTGNGIAAFDLKKKGKRLWADEPADHYDIGRAGPCIAGDVVYASRTTDDEEYGETRFLQALSLKTGKELWRVEGRELDLDDFSWYCTPCVADGVLYAQTYDLVALR